MLITLIVISFFVIIFGVTLFGLKKDYWDCMEHPGLCFLSLIVGIVLFCVIINLFIQPISTKSHIAEFKAIQATFQEARLNQNISALELVAIQQKVAERNEWLARTKFWAKHKLTNWFYPKEVFELMPIK